MRQETALLLDAAGERKAVALLNQFLKRLSVELEDKSRLISISFTSTDPKKAALIANKLVDEYMESQLEAKSEGARRAAEWLEVRLAELGETVKSLEQSVQQQRAESGSDGIEHRLPTPGGAHQPVSRRSGGISGSRGAL